MGNELVDYIPGLPPTRIADLPTCLYGKGNQILNKALESISTTETKAQYLLLASPYELEQQVIDALTTKLSPFPVYHIGPNIPYYKLDSPNYSSRNTSHADHSEWLDKQPRGSVLYVSQGSLFSTSKAQMEEITSGLRDSGVRYFWVGREEHSRLRENCGGGNGMVVPWCDQLRVLCHPSIGGFWSHCGWNSTSEAAFAGVPMLNFPIYWDQVTNSKMVVEDWKMGWKVKRGFGDEEVLVGRQEIAGIVRRFMDVEKEEEVRDMRRRACELRDTCRRAVGKGGSSDAHIEAFLNDICQNANKT